nr:LytTR family DNA-binding domain-containing protein [Acetivibrio ethanolgignens]
MLRVAVCDDTLEECRMIADYTECFFEERQMEASVDAFGSMEDLLNSDNSYELYLLDVMMPGISGIDGAGSLRKKVKNPVIVFITSSLESAVEGYRVNASGFILKPVEKERFEETMDRVLEQKLGQRKKFISLTYNRVPLKLQLERVAYFENRLHRVYVMLTDGEVLSVGQKLSQIQENLESDGMFLRCHQSYLVNLEQVEEMMNSCFRLKGGIMIPISRNFYKQSKNAYYHYRLKETL